MLGEIATLAQGNIHNGKSTSKARYPRPGRDLRGLVFGIARAFRRALGRDSRAGADRVCNLVWRWHARAGKLYDGGDSAPESRVTIGRPRHGRSNDLPGKIGGTHDEE